MEADFMAMQARLHNKIIFLIIFGYSCHTPVAPIAGYSMINADAAGLHTVNGIVMFHDQPFTGGVFTLYPGTTDSARIAIYQLGKEHGIWKKWYPGGKPEEIRRFDNGRKTGEYLAFWENGNKQMDYFFEEDEYQGNCREWNQEGILIKNMHYNRGYEEGVQQLFYDNGKTRSNYVVKNGRRYGLLGTKNCVSATDSMAIKP
jgi:hypothetical protein